MQFESVAPEGWSRHSVVVVTGENDLLQ